MKKDENDFTLINDMLNPGRMLDREIWNDVNNRAIERRKGGQSKRGVQDLEASLPQADAQTLDADDRRFVDFIVSLISDSPSQLSEDEKTCVQSLSRDRVLKKAVLTLSDRIGAHKPCDSAIKIKFFDVYFEELENLKSANENMSKALNQLHSIDSQETSTEQTASASFIDALNRYQTQRLKIKIAFALLEAAL